MVGRTTLFLAIAACAALYVASRAALQIRPADRATATHVEGKFAADGWFPGERFAEATLVRAWGSWCGDDAHRGTLRIGPFPAPPRVRFGIGGYPRHAGNALSLELVATGERQTITMAEDVGARWKIIDVDVPANWRGKSIAIVAVDHASGPGGWLALTEPINGGRGDGVAGLLDTFAGWAINGLLLGLLWQAALDWLARSERLPPAWAPLAAAGTVAIAGYAAFWIYFSHALAGKIFSAVLLASAAGLGVARARRVGPFAKERGATAHAYAQEAASVLRVAFCLGLLYLALLELYPSSRDFDNLAANRYRENLPGDNTLPYNLARVLFDGGNPRTSQGEWQSSDRPPLQSGWVLLPWPATAALGFDARTAAGTAGVWFQFTWVAAVYGLLRSLGLTITRGAAWTTLIGLSGFCVQNTVFTWPKLAAGAFACGAFALWFLPGTGAKRRSALLAGAGLAALGWLAHGGVAFSFLALVPWALWRALRGEARDWLLAAAAFAVLALPWTAYQRWYDPPGNQLLKYHLAGEYEVNTRGVWQAMGEAYRPLTWSEILQRKQASLVLQVTGNWRGLADFSGERARASARREDEFFRPARALGWWWLLGLMAVGWALVSPHRRRALAESARAQLSLVGWILLTTMIWCALIFTPGEAVIHQGSYATMLTAYVLLSVWLERASRWALAAIGMLQGFALATTYAVPNALVHGSALGWPLVVLGAVAVAWTVFPALRAPADSAGQPT